MLDPEVRARLVASAAEYDRIAEIAARQMDIGVSADAKQSASDIRLMILAAEDEAPADRPSYAQVMATAIQYERLLLLLILQAGGELRVSSATSLEHGPAVIGQRYRVVHFTDEKTGAFVVQAAKNSKLT